MQKEKINCFEEHVVVKHKGEDKRVNNQITRNKWTWCKRRKSVYFAAWMQIHSIRVSWSDFKSNIHIMYANDAGCM